MNQENENLREFDLATVLTVTTSRLLTDMDNLYDILNYLTGDDFMTHQLPRKVELLPAIF